MLTEVARGGHGRVLRAFDIRGRHSVAIKEPLSRGASALAWFERECRTLRRLRHPGIVTLVEAGYRGDGLPYFTMPYLEGMTLKQALADCTTLEERLELLPVVLEVAQAVAHAHATGVVHLDLKPSNVVLHDTGGALLIDWGLARRLPVASAGAGGRVVGTPGYMAPEQARGQEVDERTDVYGLGALLYHLLAGVAPYRGRDSQAVLEQVRTRIPRPIAALVPEVPRGLAALVRRAMAREAAQRHPGAQAFAEALCRLGGTLSVHKALSCAC
jgi:serine/threonine protein kinase